jgi:hypothetical protein
MQLKKSTFNVLKQHASINAELPVKKIEQLNTQIVTVAV